MRLQIAGFLLSMGVLPSLALAGDNVAYQLDTKELTPPDEPKLAEPLTMQVRDREWVTLGLEEALGDRRVGPDCWRGPHEIRLSKPNSSSLEKEFWPRTRELLHGPDAQALRLSGSVF